MTEGVVEVRRGVVRLGPGGAESCSRPIRATCRPALCSRLLSPAGRTHAHSSTCMGGAGARRRPHLLRSRKGEDIAASLLCLGGAHALERQRLGHHLAGASHGAWGGWGRQRRSVRTAKVERTQRGWHTAASWCACQKRLPAVAYVTTLLHQGKHRRVEHPCSYLMNPRAQPSLRCTSHLKCPHRAGWARGRQLAGSHAGQG